MLFAAMVIERAPMKWAELPVSLRGWAQTSGVIAAIGLLIYLISSFFRHRAWQHGGREQVLGGAGSDAAVRPRAAEDPAGKPRKVAFLVFLVLSFALFIFLGIIFLGRAINIRALAQMVPTGEQLDPRTGIRTPPAIGDWVFSFAGLAAILAVAAPVVIDLFFRMRLGRIWAIARLSIKEAIRSRVVWLFALIGLVFLFGGWFTSPRPEDQLRNNVAVIFLSVLLLFLVSASLLGAFTIPADIRSQSIHTIVTKPVEKFEIVLGRFLGYALLMTIAVFVIGGLSLVFVMRGVHPDAEKESFKARVPIYGTLGFEGTRGESVGRVWDYRKYISGRSARDTGAKEQFAHWSFGELPSNLAQRSEPVRFEFTFDIYRMTKGQENKGVFCNFLFVDGRLDRDEMQQRLSRFREDRKKYQSLVSELVKGTPVAQMLPRIQDQMQADYPQEGAAAVKLAEGYRQQVAAPAPDSVKMVRQEVENLLTLLHGIFSPPTIEVKDYHTQSVEVPAQLFLYLQNAESTQPRKSNSQGITDPILRTWVSVDSSDAVNATNAPQMLGVATADLYLLANEQPFWVNYLKGVVGLWFTFLLVLGIAVPLSTYLSGVITWLCTMFLFFAGMARDFVQKLADGTHEGGGPMQSIYRIFTQTFHSGQLDDTPTTTALRDVDAVYQFIFRLVHSILPDIERFDLQEYVANGFDIAWGQILVLNCLLPLVGYIVPWLILGYYLINSREIANPN